MTSEYPYPPRNGYAVRCYNVARMLARNHEVHLLSFVRNKEAQNYCANASSVFRSIVCVPGANTSVVALLRATFSVLPLHVVSHLDKHFRQWLHTLLRRYQFDVIYGNFIYFSPYLEELKGSGPILVLDQHNLDRDVWEQKARHETSFTRRYYSKLNLFKTICYERRVYRMYDLVVSVSEEDRSRTLRISNGLNVITAPSAVDCVAFKPLDHVTRRRNTLLFVGSGAEMNLQAIHVFAKAVLPRVLNEVPGATFEIVGSIPRERLGRLVTHPRVRYVGPVDDVRPYLWETSVFVAPFLMGGGVKLKMLEAMAAGCPIVSTPVGIQGIRILNGVHAVVAASWEAFAQATVDLLQDPAKAETLGRAAMKLAQAEYDWSRTGDVIEDALLKLVWAKKGVTSGQPAELG